MTESSAGESTTPEISLSFLQGHTFRLAKQYIVCSWTENTAPRMSNAPLSEEIRTIHSFPQSHNDCLTWDMCKTW